MCAKACPPRALLSVEVRFEATRVPCGSIINLLNDLGVKGVNGLHPELEEWRAGREAGQKLSIVIGRGGEKESHTERQGRHRHSRIPPLLWDWWSCKQ